jgi:hypothetical protein
MAMSELLRPKDLQEIASKADMAKAQEYMDRAKKQDDEATQLRDAFMDRTVHPEAKDRVNRAVRRAAEQGHREIQALTFRADYCNDKGRRINNNEPDWPESLEGFAKRAYDFFDAELKPLGFKISVQVLDYPGGMPGNIGMILKW